MSRSLPPVVGLCSSEEVVERASIGARVLTARGVGMRVVSLASYFVLFALVSPADLGLLAVVRGITALAGNTTDLGFAWALLRREAVPSREEYGALAGVQLAIVLALLAVIAVKPSLLTTIGAVAPEWHLWMLAALATTVTVPFGTSAKIRIERSLDYRRIAFYDMSSVLLQNLVLLGFAARGFFSIGVFIATGGTILYSNILLWCWSPGPGPSFQRAAWRRLAGEFAGFSFGHICYLLYSSATPILIAKLFGLSTAGLWAFATRVGNILQVAFEGFRRAAVPAAALLTRSLDHLRRLVEDSLLSAARLTVPVIAAIYAGLPAVGLLWPRWQPAVRVGQLYALGFGLSGLLSACLVPAAVALRGPSVVVAEQVAPMAAGWTVLLLLRLLGRPELGWVMFPMFGALTVALWHVTDRAVRPRFHPELRRLGLALAAVVILTNAGQVVGAQPVLVALIAGALFLSLWAMPRGLVRVRAVL